MLKLIRLLTLAAGFVLAGWTGAQAQQYPTSMVTMVVPFPAGAGLDFLTRLLAEKFQERWAQTVIVDNRVGASGVIGADYVARSAPDGRVLLLIPLDVMINPVVFPRPASDPIKNLTPIASLATTSFFLAANPKAGIATVSDLVEQARKDPGKISYGTCGSGSPGRVIAGMLAEQAKIQITHISYRGGCGPAVADTMGGHIPFVISGAGTVGEPFAANLLTPVAVANPERDSRWPNIPTIAESGYPEIKLASWFGLFAAPKTPPEIVNKIYADLQAIYADPAVQKRISDRILVPYLHSPQEFEAIIARDVPRLGRVLLEISKTEK